MSSSSSSLKILCLHGWRTNTDVMEFQLMDFKRTFKNLEVTVDWHLLQAPNKASGPPPADIAMFFGTDGNYFEWWDHRCEAGNDGINKLIGMEQSLKKVHTYIEQHGPFDAIIGFSQGSTLACILTRQYYDNTMSMSQKTSTTTTTTTKKKKKGVVPWNWSIHVSGDFDEKKHYPEKQQEEQSLPIDQKSIFIVGDEDIAIPPEDTLQHLASIYDSNQQIIYTHSEGHKFPMWTKFSPSYLEIATKLLSTKKLKKIQQ